VNGRSPDAEQVGERNLEHGHQGVRITGASKQKEEKTVCSSQEAGEEEKVLQILLKPEEESFPNRGSAKERKKGGVIAVNSGGGVDLVTRRNYLLGQMIEGGERGRREIKNLWFSRESIARYKEGGVA